MKYGKMMIVMTNGQAPLVVGVEDDGLEDDDTVMVVKSR
jgi:hypothetical protein